MGPHLFRVEGIPGVGDLVELGGAEARHAGAAVRVQPGERIRVGDGRGIVADCEVVSAASSHVTARVLTVVEVQRPVPEVIVVQALPKSERSELAVELATEAGADRIVPWQASRCVSRWSGPKVDKGLAKWRNTTRVATKQSRRAWEPEIDAPVDTNGLVAMVTEVVRGGGRALLLHEEGALPLAATVHRGLDQILLMVGPEGGVSDEERDALLAAGASAVVLGPEVLRTSTAAAVALGALGVLTRRWGTRATTLETVHHTTGE